MHHIFPKDVQRKIQVKHRNVKSTRCDGAVAGGRIELGPPVESSDLDEKVLTTTPVRDTSSVRIWVES
jgi:hypothetical protein